VEFYQDRLEAFSLSIRQVIDTIGKNNVNLLTGKRDEGSSGYYVRAMGQYKTLDELRDLVVLKSREGSVIRLSDVADVKDFYLEAQGYARLNREPTVSIYVQKENDSNTIRVAERVRKVAEKARVKYLNDQITMGITSDQSLFVSQAMSNVMQSLTMGMVLTFLVIFFFLKEWRHTFIIFVSVPIAILITLSLMLLSGLTLNYMTLSALALGVGMVVDNSIVVLENILEKKRKRLHAGIPPDTVKDVVEGTDELFVSLMGGTLTTIVVFLPIVFISQQVKILYSGLAFTITFSLIASLFVATTLVPLLASRIPLPLYDGYFPPHVKAKINVFLAGWSFKKSTFFSKGFVAFFRIWCVVFPKEGVSSLPRFRVFGLWYKTIWPFLRKEISFARSSPTRAYLRWCVRSIRHQKWLFLFVTAATVLAVSYYALLMEKDFMGSTEQNEFVVFIELPAGAKLDISDKVVQEVEALLSDMPEIKDSVKTAAARVEGWSSKIYVTLKPRTERSRSVEDVIRELRPKVADIGQQFDTFIYFSEPATSKEFLIDVFGPDYDTLRDTASAIAQKIQSIPELADVKLRYKPGQPEVQIQVDKDRAALFGLVTKDIAEDLHARIRGLRPSYFFTDASQLEIIARDKEQFRKSLDDIQYLTLVSNDGEVVGLKQFSSFQFALTPSEIWRKDKQRVIQVSSNRNKLAMSSAARQTTRALHGLDIPTGYYFQVGGDYLDMLQNEKEFRFAFFVMAGLVFIVLASLLESNVQAVVIMLTIPMALVGSVLFLWVTHTPATTSVYIGVILLGGIAVNSAIILVDKINQSLAVGIGLERSVLGSCVSRLPAVLCTSITTMAGQVPMMLSRSESAQLWSPLALTQIGGLSLATFLTLFMIPAIYYHTKVYTARWKNPPNACK